MSLETALSLIETSHAKALFVGETIEDVYHYVTPLGRPLKELILSVQQERTERFAGGVQAAALHAWGFCERVDVYSDRVVTKERYVDQAHMRKLFQVYTGTKIISESMDAYGAVDIVAVVDYGHGMMTGEVIDVLDIGYLAVNVQTNSGNYGFNLATKYQFADYLVVDELEARLATQNRDDDIRLSIEELSRIAPKGAITLGRDGAIGWPGNVRVPAFTDRVVDTMGAGDAFFAVTAVMAKDAAIEDLLLIGNAAGALKTQIVGHRESVTKPALIDYLKAHGTR